ncbi:hypothetical protein AK830_g1977 [Neonectria ditissima]|uniref:Tubby C-terminal domain-containing protein n=1 Tax=Neonectria ditissima TaxID=78410 RepID=A0A0P7BLC9_9HYPO|nr:hypothetical protein AK830_g1977 [Neonectria ditissima]
MRGTISNFLSSTEKPSNPGSQIFQIRPSPHGHGLLVVHPAGYPKDAPPMYCIKVKPSSKPNVVLSRGPMSPQTTVGHARFHFFSSTTELFVRGQPVPLKASTFSGKFTMDIPGMGKFKWKPNQLTGTSFELFDGAGRKLAKLGSAGLLAFGEKKLELMVPCDDFFLDLVLLSAISVKELSKIAGEAASGATEAVIGAA